jgi:hypothetical protein
MSLKLFNILVEMLGNKSKSHARSDAGPIIPEIRLQHVLMRYLARGLYLDIYVLLFPSLILHYTTPFKILTML